MNDTHGQQGEGWIGFDLDGTLAKYDGWKGIDHIGEPVGPMVDLVKKMHADGRRVKVLTARVAPHKLEDGTTGEAYITVPGKDGGSTRQYARQYVADWCHFYLGFIPEITHEKDHLMLDLYDDRCHQVVPNTGEIVEEQRDELVKALEKSATLLDAMDDLVHKKDRELRVKEVHVVHDTRTVDIRWVSGILIFLTGLCLGATLIFCLEGWLTASSVGEKERKLHEAIHEYMGELVHERAHGYVERVSGAVVP